MKKTKQSAFSLIEVLIAWLIVSTAVAGLLRAEIHALRLTRQSFDRSMCGGEVIRYANGLRAC